MSRNIAKQKLETSKVVHSLIREYPRQVRQWFNKECLPHFKCLSFNKLTNDVKHITHCIQVHIATTKLTPSWLIYTPLSFPVRSPHLSYLSLAERESWAVCVNTGLEFFIQLNNLFSWHMKIILKSKGSINIK